MNGMLIYKDRTAQGKQFKLQVDKNGYTMFTQEDGSWVEHYGGTGLASAKEVWHDTLSELISFPNNYRIIEIRYNDPLTNL